MSMGAETGRLAEGRVLMNMNRLAGWVTVLAGFFFLSAAAGFTSAQVPQPAAAQPTHLVAPAARPEGNARSTNYFAGLKYTDEQKAKIDEIHRRMALRKDAVLKSEMLDAEQKGAMTAGLGRMERGEIARLLTPEQKKEVLKKAHAAQVAAGNEKQQSSQ
jgi:Spy/CpxP family protein refolding chaperone